MQPTELERIVATDVRIGDVLVDRTRTVQVLGASPHPGTGTVKLVFHAVGTPLGVRPRVLWVGERAPLLRFASNVELIASQAEGLI
jgi:hypothetical protein